MPCISASSTIIQSMYSKIMPTIPAGDVSLVSQISVQESIYTTLAENATPFAAICGSIVVFSLLFIMIFFSQSSFSAGDGSESFRYRSLRQTTSPLRTSDLPTSELNPVRSLQIHADWHGSNTLNTPWGFTL